MINVDDPELTLSEALNVMGLIGDRLKVSEDAVLLSAWDKLLGVCRTVARDEPAEFQAIEQEIAMQKQLKSKTRYPRV